MCDRLVLDLHDLHLRDEAFSQLPHLMGLQHEFFTGAHLVLHLLHLLDGLILGLNVFLDLSQIFGNFAVILLIFIILRLGDGLGRGEDVLDRVGDYEVFVGLESHDGLIVLGDNWWFPVHLLLFSGGDGPGAFDLFADAGSPHGAGELFLVVGRQRLVLSFEFSHGLIVARVGVGSHESLSVSAEI